MTYEHMALEFPEYDQSTLPPIPDDGYWEDSSWHNDACPSFYISEAQCSVYIDFAKPEEREFPGTDCRFVVLLTSYPPDGDPDLLHTNDWQAVLDLVNERACPALHGAHRDTGRGVCAHCGKVLA